MIKRFIKVGVIGLGIIGLSSVGLWACDDGDGGGSTPAPESIEPGFHELVAPILHARCTGCHAEGGVGPFALDRYETAKPLANLIIDAIEDGSMPPWGAEETEECAPRLGWKDDIRLTDDEKATVRAWVDAGAPEGDPANALPPAPTPTPDNLPDMTRELSPASPFVAEGERDQFRCFVLDPGNTEEMYLNGVHFIPGDPEVVHHILLYLDRAGVSEDMKDGAPDNGYDCFGGPGFASPELVAPWAPGAVATQLPEGVGVPVPAGARLVMQIHYHPIAGETHSDTSTIQLRETNVSPEYFGLSILIGNFDEQDDNGDGLQADVNGDVEFRVPAGAKDHVETMKFTVPPDFDGRPSPGAFIYAVGTHMHYVGTDMRIDFKRAEKTAACTTGQLDPLDGCLAVECVDMSGEDLVDCAVEKCAGHLAPLAGSCLDCLGASPDDRATCTQVARFDQYGSIPEQPAEECLVQTPKWNFEWQRWYVYDEPELTKLPFLAPGDTIEAKCVYDNSMDNPFVRRALSEQGLTEPHDVVLGDETLDEMCLVVMELIYRWPDAE